MALSTNLTREKEETPCVLDECLRRRWSDASGNAKPAVIPHGWSVIGVRRYIGDFAGTRSDDGIPVLVK